MGPWLLYIKLITGFGIPFSTLAEKLDYTVGVTENNLDYMNLKNSCAHHEVEAQEVYKTLYTPKVCMILTEQSFGNIKNIALRQM